MKKVLYAFLAVALAFAASSCSYEKDLDIDTNGGNGLDFVHFATASESWSVEEADESFLYNIPVGRTLPQSQAATYNVSLGPGTTGVEGKDFVLVTKSITIPAGEQIGYAQVEIPYETTGVVFKIELVLDIAENLVNPSYGTSHIINVSTDKFPYSWDWLEGNWSASDYFYYYDLELGPYTVSIEKVDETTCKISGVGQTNFAPWDLVGTVDFDKKTITIPGYIKGGYDEDVASDLYWIAVDPDAGYDRYEDLATPLVIKFSPETLSLGPWDAYIVDGQYKGYTYVGGLATTLSK